MPFKTAAFTANAPGCRVTKNRLLTLFWPVYACKFFYVNRLCSFRSKPIKCNNKHDVNEMKKYLKYTIY